MTSGAGRRPLGIQSHPHHLLKVILTLQSPCFLICNNKGSQRGIIYKLVHIKSDNPQKLSAVRGTEQALLLRVASAREGPQEHTWL